MKNLVQFLHFLKQNIFKKFFNLENGRVYALTLGCFIFVSPIASHVGMIDFMVVSLLCGTLQSMVLRNEKCYNWGICISFDVQS